MKVRFAGCTLDTDARQLFRGTFEVRLSPKAFEALRVLVENRHRAVPKAELLDLVWPRVFVSDASLARVINEIRDGVGDDARRPHIVRTVHGFGYAFAAETEQLQPTAAETGDSRAQCWLVRGDRTIPLSDGEHVAGREPGVTVWLDSAKVSRRHARILVRGATATIEDLGSKNGTFVRGARIAGATPLQPGDELRIGPFTLTLHVARGPATTETEIV